MSGLALLALLGAIVMEVSGTLSLRKATDGPRRWWIGVVLCYAVAFTLLAVTLQLGVPLGVAYGIWAATGVALIAILDRLIFKEPLTWVMSLGIILIVGGVLLIETGGAH
ncbi:MAG: DMT family transporter [Gulosibacter sp.]|uniref:DMT family transporter n=1 Tax=Gulosibacter sp. TaxID=2817531 RepID=UPI003F935932